MVTTELSLIFLFLDDIPKESNKYKFLSLRLLSWIAKSLHAAPNVVLLEVLVLPFLIIFCADAVGVKILVTTSTQRLSLRSAH